MSPKPFWLSEYELQWARTGEVPDESSYRNHELRNQVQEKVDAINARLDTLRRDLEAISYNEDVELPLPRSPRDLGKTVGFVAEQLLSSDELADGVESRAEFLAGVVRELDTEAPHDSVTAQRGMEKRIDLMDRTVQKTRKEVKQEVSVVEDTFERFNEKDQTAERARTRIREILDAENYPVSDWVVEQISRGVLEKPEGYPLQHLDWDPVEELSKRAVLQYASEQSLSERHVLREQIGRDVRRLHKEWRGVQPVDIFEIIAERWDGRSILTADIVRETGDQDIVVAILNDLAGVTGRRETLHDRVHTDAPILAKTNSNRWEMTDYGEALVDWLFEEGLGFSSTAPEEQAEIVESLGLSD